MDVECCHKGDKNIYILTKKLSNEDIALKCRKILALKYWSGLNRIQPVNKLKIESELYSLFDKALIYDLYANALTVSEQ